MPQKIAAGNWKMNGTQASLSEIQAIAKPHKRVTARPFYARRRICYTARPAWLDHWPSAGRIATTPRQVPSPATSAPRSWPIAVPPMSSLATPRGAKAMARATVWCAPRPKRPSNPGSRPSSALVRAKSNAPQVRRLRSCWRSCPAPCPMMPRSSLPMSQFGPLARVLFPLWLKSPKSMMLCALSSMPIFGAAGQDISILYGGSVKPSNAKKFSPSPNVNGALVGGASLKAEDFLPIMRSLAES